MIQLVMAVKLIYGVKRGVEVTALLGTCNDSGVVW